MITKYILPIVLQHYCKSGSSYTSVFTVVIPGVTVALNAVTPPIYYGRVRSFDSSGNRGSWTSLIGSVATLIDSAEITELTATKIKAGTITSSVIALDGVNSIIKSSGYVAGANGSGWAIKGDGNAEFSAASIRGAITANSVTTTGLTISSDGTVTTTSGKFGVTAGGVLSATGATISGAITATSGTFTGTVNASGGTMSGYLRAGDVYIGKNVNDAAEHNGIGIDGSWNNAWVRRESNDTAYFRAGSASRYIQVDTGGSSGIYFPYFSVDNDGNMTALTANISGTVTTGNLTATGGSVGGWTIDGGSIRTAGTYYGDNNAVNPIAALLSNGAFVVYQYAPSSAPGSFVVDPDNGVLVNAISMRSRTTGGSKTHWYPFFDNNKACGVSDFRWTEIWAIDSTINSSDARTKTAIEDISIGLDFINDLRPVSYMRIASYLEPVLDENGKEIRDPITNKAEMKTGAPGKRKHLGLIAQEVKQAIDKNNIDPKDFGPWILTNTEDPDSDQALRYEEFISPIIKAIQELSAKVAALESKMI